MTSHATLTAALPAHLLAAILALSTAAAGGCGDLAAADPLCPPHAAGLPSPSAARCAEPAALIVPPAPSTAGADLFIGAGPPAPAPAPAPSVAPAGASSRGPRTYAFSATITAAGVPLREDDSSGVRASQSDGVRVRVIQFIADPEDWRGNAEGMPTSAGPTAPPVSRRPRRHT